MAFAAGNLRGKNAGAMDQGSNANSGMGSPRPANSALANSDMQDGVGMQDSDNSYAEL